MITDNTWQSPAVQFHREILDHIKKKKIIQQNSTTHKILNCLQQTTDIIHANKMHLLSFLKKKKKKKKKIKTFGNWVSYYYAYYRQ